MKIVKLIYFFKTNGPWNTITYSVQKVKRKIIPSKVVLFYIDLIDRDNKRCELPDDYNIEKINSFNEIRQDDLNVLNRYLGKKKISNQINKRFEIPQTCLNLLKVDNKLVGFIWTIRGGYVVPFYFPVLENDAVIFDVVIFPKYRGQRLSSIFTEYITCLLRNDGLIRIFISVATWNNSSLRWVKKMDYRRLGTTRKFRMFHIYLTRWYNL